ncbi:MAG: glycosyltransferase [archaeon]|nr:glycosyltransferase [archaeon]
MKILLIASLFSEGNTVLLVSKALNNLGHSVYFYNYVIEEKHVNDDFDLCIVWTNRPFDPKILNGKPFAYMYLDDPYFWKLAKPEFNIDVMCKDFEHVFTNMKWEGYDSNRYHFLPFGVLQEIHSLINMSEEDIKIYESDICFVGTVRGNRENFIRKIASKIDLKKYKFKIWGNGWDSIIKTKPAYFYDMSKILSTSKIVITEHFKNGFSTADFEKPAVGGALMISDIDMIKEVYPMCPVYHNEDELLNIINYYLEHKDERLKIVKEMQIIAHKNFTYEIQLKKMIEIIMNDQKVV